MRIEIERGRETGVGRRGRARETDIGVEIVETIRINIGRIGLEKNKILRETRIGKSTNSQRVVEKSIRKVVRKRSIPPRIELLKVVVKVVGKSIRNRVEIERVEEGEREIIVAEGREEGYQREVIGENQKGNIIEMIVNESLSSRREGQSEISTHPLYVR
uniref:Uncharacterized protein n=1 Tax=Cacopsylla melanoneura TaxID=428564 RepID=A0A8D9A059_9HEMI